MKKQLIMKALFRAAAIALTLSSCKKGNMTPMTTAQFNVSQTNLVADKDGYNAVKIDPDLINAWGLAANEGGIVWVASNRKSLSTIYDTTGQILRPPANIPSANGNLMGKPTGMVFNSSADFGGNKFIFSGEDGTITAWIRDDNATVVANGIPGSAYKGLALATNAGANFLYAANFRVARIDVFDKAFKSVTTNGFKDPNIPAGFAPFNIQTIGGMLYVTYAKLAGPDNEDDSPGAGNGYVDVFKPDGTLVKRFASQGSLNSPWGITHAPAGFAATTETILVGNFGDGKINIFDMNGDFKGQLQANGKAISIEGLWALDFVKMTPTAGSNLYFTAGPGGEAHGLFGFLKTAMVTNTGNNNGDNNGGSGPNGY
ncbi:TIGR03118 family protein [Mucilaginibacter sabulilitoris]|uniref:TIGR03118 family protein n=1 Tax=Mucilaginibacter sabulilitoris TaxID=1173583 RepID=A0ABZ0TY13_9SPHI|nr:TIGR03118 family protein [Mucilaginibacter sabulilitoris]WPU97043.1 TIGR03118 family protein [Mucilaginibacter sabulilitoris]